MWKEKILNMCGIVGYVGNENAPFIVEKSLKKL